MNAFEELMSTGGCLGCNKADVDVKLCSDCQEWTKRLDFPFTNRALYKYNAAMKAFMHRYKFVGDYRLRQVFAVKFSQSVREQNRVVVPIPLHPATLEQRAFNQTIGLLHVEVVEALATINEAKQVDQSSRTRDQRKAIVQPFRIVKKFKPHIVDKDVLIVDDVYTTGTTIRLAAQTLIDAGVKSVKGLTLAR
ncbi:ComF family protein [Lactobacillaceae bacterium Melli_B4]